MSTETAECSLRNQSQMVHLMLGIAGHIPHDLCPQLKLWGTRMDLCPWLQFTFRLMGSFMSAGGKATGVPGEILGYYEAWLQFGRLPWERLFEPAISLCRRGFNVGRAMAERIQYTLDKNKFTDSLRCACMRCCIFSFSEDRNLSIKIIDLFC